MCGLVGFLVDSKGLGSHNTQQTLSDHSLLKKMSDTLAHRGPDDAETWVDTKAGFGLGHRRLSIIDLSIAGKQPMKSDSGRYVID